MISKQFEEDLRQIVQMLYCHYGREKLVDRMKLIKDFVISKEGKEVVKIMSNQIKEIDKRFDEYYRDRVNEYYKKIKELGKN